MGPFFITREKMKVADSFPMNQHIVVMLKSLFLEKRENFYMEYNRVQTEHRNYRPKPKQANKKLKLTKQKSIKEIKYKWIEAYSRRFQKPKVRCCCYYPLIIAHRREGIIGFGMNSKKGSKIGQNENLGSK